MEPGAFTINGVTSESLGAFIQSRPLIKTPKRRIDFKSPYGYDGGMPFDEGGYEATDMELAIYILGDETNTAAKNRTKLFAQFDTAEYVDFVPYFDEEKVYRVMLDSPPEFISRSMLGEGQSMNVKLKVHPWKYTLPRWYYIITSGDDVFNQTLFTALPLIQITGTGDVTVTVNGVDFAIQGISEHIYIDSEIMFAYKDNTGVLVNENSKIYTREYPKLDPENNIITWTGTVTEFKIWPRWRVLA